jgi:pilus assembly protein CpaB
MNRTLLFAGIGALGSALLVAMLLSALMGKKDDKALPSHEVLIANRDLTIGSVLNKGNTRWQKWPGTPVPGSLIKGEIEEKEWMDQKIRRALTKDEPITRGALLIIQKGSLISARLEKNMRAISIEVEADTGVAGFLSPDDHVDVILTYTMRVQSSNNSNALQEIAVEKASETILSNIRVLATDQDAEGQVAGEDKPKISKTITLEVTKEGAEKIALATQLGRLHLSLRQMGDGDAENDPITPDVTDVSMSRILKRTIDVRNRMEDPGASVRVYSGQSVQEVPVRRSTTGGAQ